MKITKGIGTEASLLPRYGINLQNALEMIDHWVDRLRDEMRAVPIEEACGNQLFYRDGLFEDLMLRLDRAALSRGGHLDLVLARVFLPARQRGRGHFSALRAHLERKAEQIGARFIVEAANPVLGGKLRSTQKYTRMEPDSNPLGMMFDNYHESWLYSPDGSGKEISLPISHRQFAQLKRNLIDMDESQLDDLRRLIARFVERISEKGGAGDANTA